MSVMKNKPFLIRQTIERTLLVWAPSREAVENTVYHSSATPQRQAEADDLLLRLERTPDTSTDELEIDEAGDEEFIDGMYVLGQTKPLFD